ncbi:MAG: ABC transporter substrate-binding protein [Candidatus Nezhaarchaeales archaeon]
MNKSLSLIVAITLALLAVTPSLGSIVTFAEQTNPEAPYGPWVDRIVYFRVADEGLAVRLIEQGEMHAWLYNPSKVETIKSIETSPEVDIIATYAGVYDLFVNPCHFKEGFNPFAISEVREALNYIIDRRYIANEILKGYGIPRLTVFRSVSMDYHRMYDLVSSLERQYAYDFEKGLAMISEALIKAGAELVDGKWYYGGSPITIKFFIRIEDVRKDIGDYIAGQLEKVGFKVERLYKPGRDAIPIVYGGDPTTGQWNLYTEGWAYYGLSIYDDTDPEYYCTSPYSGAVFDYYKPPAELVYLARKLASAEYESMEERMSLIREITKLALKDSVRIWLIDQVTPFPFSATLDKNKMVYDLYAGLWYALSSRTMKFKDKIGGELKLGNRLMFVSAFNPIGGEKWIYETVITTGVRDFGVFVHPHSGHYMPVRAQFSVTTAGPDGKLNVPGNAIIFDVKTMTWKEVGANVSATSKVTFNFVFGKWHNGLPVNMNDVLMWIAEYFLVASPESPVYDAAAVTPGLQTFVSKLRGVRILNSTSIEVYIDYWHIDPTFIAAQADVWPALPWEVAALMNAAVKDRKLAFSDTTSESWGVEWLDLTKGESLSILEGYLQDMSSKNYVPEAIANMVTKEEASQRWRALQEWYKNRGHFYISNGPFYIELVDTKALQVVLSAFREYPLKADYWAHLATPKKPSISVSVPPTLIPGFEASITVTATLDGKPYPDVDVTYFLFNPQGVLVCKGKALMAAEGTFTVKFSSSETGALTPGAYELTIVAASAGIASPDVITKILTVQPLAPYLKGLIDEAVASFNARASQIETSLDRLSSTIAELQGALSAVTGLVIVSIVIAVIAIGIAVLTFKRKTKTPP